MEYSKNKRAEEILGLRDLGDKDRFTIVVDMPCELGYKCPVCKKEEDQNLDFSEYNGMLYCYKCNKDYFSFQCVDDIDKQINIALDIINYIKNNK